MRSMLLYQILFCTTDGKIQRSQTKAMNLKYQVQYGIGNFMYLIDLYTVSDIQGFFEYIWKNMVGRLIILQ